MTKQRGKTREVRTNVKKQKMDRTFGHRVDVSDA